MFRKPILTRAIPGIHHSQEVVPLPRTEPSLPIAIAADQEAFPPYLHVRCALPNRWIEADWSQTPIGCSVGGSGASARVACSRSRRLQADLRRPPAQRGGLRRGDTRSRLCGRPLRPPLRPGDRSDEGDGYSHLSQPDLQRQAGQRHRPVARDARSGPERRARTRLGGGHQQLRSVPGDEMGLPGAPGRAQGRQRSCRRHRSCAWRPGMAPGHSGTRRAS